MRMMICRGPSPGAVVRAETNASDAIACRIAPPSAAVRLTMEQCFCPALRSASVRPVRKIRMQRHVPPGGSGFLSPSSAARAIVRCRPPDVVVRATLRTQIPLSVRRRKASAGRLGVLRPAQPFVCPGNPRRSLSGDVPCAAVGSVPPRDWLPGSGNPAQPFVPERAGGVWRGESKRAPETAPMKNHT